MTSGGAGGGATDAAPSDAPSEGAGSDGAGAGGMGGQPAPGVPVFVASGFIGRTIISCDDGQSWIRSRSDNDAFNCSGVDCDHHPGAPTGLGSGNGWVIASFGWGAGPGSIRRTRDAIQWEVVQRTAIVSGLAASGSVAVGASPSAWISRDNGATWAQSRPLPVGPPTRRILHIPHGRGRFLLSGESAGATQVMLSDDDGATWAPARSVPAGCIPHKLGYGNGVAIMVGSRGELCRSLDGGETWTREQQLAATVGISNQILSSGSRLMLWGVVGTTRMLLQSSDGAQWTTTPTSPPGVEVRSVARSDTGTFVTIQSQYQNQIFFRSTDGANWTAVPDARVTKGHLINNIMFARLGSGEACR